MKKVKGLENGLNLPKHMAEHIYMFGGESTPVTFVAKKYLINDIIDWFGTDIEFSNETEYDVTVRVNVNLEAMRRWAMQYALHVKIISPQTLVDEVMEDRKNRIEEKMDVTQGKLVIGLDITRYKENSRYANSIYNVILGESATEEQVSDLLNNFHNSLKAKEDENKKLQSKLDSQKDYAELKKQLDTLNNINIKIDFPKMQL